MTEDVVDSAHHVQELSVLGMEDDEETRSLWWRPQDVRLGRETISAQVLAQRVEDFVATMKTVLARLPQVVGQYEVEQITVAAEVSAKGRVSLLGSGGELAGKGGLTFTFRKSRGGRLEVTAPSPDKSDDEDPDEAERSREEVS